MWTILLTRKYFESCQNNITPSLSTELCIIEIIKLSQEEIERMNQTHENRIGKRANFSGNYHMHSLGNINLG